MVEASPISAAELASLEAAGLGVLGAKLVQMHEQLGHARREIDWRDAKIEKLTFEMAQLKRVKFGKKSEQLDAEQKALWRCSMKPWMPTLRRSRRSSKNCSRRRSRANRRNGPLLSKTAVPRS